MSEMRGEMRRVAGWAHGAAGCRLQAGHTGLQPRVLQVACRGLQVAGCRFQAARASSRSGPNFSSAVLVAATMKQGHGVTASPTRRHSPLSTSGLVVNFSHMKAAACSK